MVYQHIQRSKIAPPRGSHLDWGGRALKIFSPTGVIVLDLVALCQTAWRIGCQKCARSDLLHGARCWKSKRFVTVPYVVDAENFINIRSQYFDLYSVTTHRRHYYAAINIEQKG